MSQTHGEGPDVGLTIASSPRPGHDFSRISIHAPPVVAIQAKLAVNLPGDEYEQEADRVAEQVMQMPGSQLPPSCGEGCPENQAKPPRQGHEGLQISRAASTVTATTAVPSIVHEVLSSAGQPLDRATRAYMEPRFGHDFSQVRVHTDAQAVESARAVGAHAYTMGNAIVFGTGRFAPGTQEGRQLIAHELAHVLQQTQPSPHPRDSSRNLTPVTTANSIATGIRHLPPRMLQRDAATETDPWDKLSPSVRDEANELFEDCTNWIHFLSDAQLAHHSSLRGAWLNTLSKMSARIAELDSDSKIVGVKNAFTDFTDGIGRNVAKFVDEWASVEKRYHEEHRYLLSANVKSTNSIEAAKYIDDLYQQTKTAMHHGAEFYLTDEDYFQLKNTLDKGQHIWIGALRGARIRAKQLQEMMDAVADLRRNGEDAEKYVPGWSDQVLNEATHLNSIAKRANEGYQIETDPLAKEGSRGYQVAFSGLRNELLEKRQGTLAIKPPPQKGVLEKGVDLVKGGVEAIGGVFVEAAKQSVDLAQIGLHFVSFGKYEPKFISDLAAAAEQGATTGDLLKGMVTGLIDTPSRFLKACEDDDWEAIGRETVNLYLLAKTIKEAPETIKKIPDAVKRLPELLAKTKESLRILRARTVALGLKKEGRLLPEPPSRRVGGFARESEPPPAVAPPQTPGRRVGGFARESEPPPVVTPPQTPSRRVGGFARESEPPPAVAPPQTPSPAVGGFGRKSEPPPSRSPVPQEPPVTTHMPRARAVQGEQPVTGSAPPVATGRRRDQPVRAMAGKRSGGDEPKAGPRKTPSAAKRLEKKVVVAKEDLDRIRQLDQWEKKNKITGDVQSLRARLRSGDANTLTEAQAEFDEAQEKIAKGEKWHVEEYGEAPRQKAPEETRISTAEKSELEDLGWLKTRLPAEKDRREFMGWLKKGHKEGELGREIGTSQKETEGHEHLGPGSPEAEEKVREWEREKGRRRD